jgi:hypothetical protein
VIGHTIKGSPAIERTQLGASSAGAHRTARNARATAVFTGLALATFVFLLWVTRDTTFMLDEWDFIQGRLGNDDDAFLRPHNNHLFAVVVLIYKALWSTVGLERYWPYQATAITLHLICIGLVFELVRRRLGAPLAVAACLPLLVLGSAWEVLLTPFNYGWYVSLIALLAILLVLDREGLGWDLATGALLLLALASSSFGPPVALGVAVTCLMRRQWRRLVIAAVPAALYGLWFVVYAIGAEHQPPTQLTASPAYFVHTAAGSVAALAGVPLGLGPVRARDWFVVLVHLVTAGLFGALAFKLVTRRQSLTPAFALLLTSLVAYWAVLTVTRGYTGYAYTSRYLYIGPVLLVVVAAEYFRGRQIEPPWVVAALGAGLLAAAANTAVLLHYSDEHRHHAIVLSAELGALELARDHVAPDFRPDRDKRRAVTIVASTYFAATDRLGSSPAPTEAELEHLPEYARQAADRALQRADRLTLHPLSPEIKRMRAADRAAQPVIAKGLTTKSRTRQRGACVEVLSPAAGPSVIEEPLPGQGLVLKAQAQLNVGVRRFARAFGESHIAPERQVLVSAAPDRSRRPWQLRVVTAGRVVIC